MSDKVASGIGGIGDIVLQQPAGLDRSVGDHATHGGGSVLKPLEAIAAVQDGEVGQADLARVAGDDGGHAEEVGVEPGVRDVEFVVAAVVCFGPLELAVVSHQVVADVVGAGDGDVLAEGTGAADGGAGELGPDGAGTGRGIVRTVA